jgi:hypothetical protein
MHGSMITLRGSWPASGVASGAIGVVGNSAIFRRSGSGYRQRRLLAQALGLAGTDSNFGIRAIYRVGRLIAIVLSCRYSETNSPLGNKVRALQGGSRFRDLRNLGELANA